MNMYLLRTCLLEHNETLVKEKLYSALNLIEKGNFGKIKPWIINAVNNAFALFKQSSIFVGSNKLTSEMLARLDADAWLPKAKIIRLEGNTEKKCTSA